MTTHRLSGDDQRLPVAAMLLVGIVVVAFIAVEFKWPRFPEMDEIFFKAAGRNIAAGGAFAAPELRGFLHADPPLERIYFSHPPVYTWCFGQVAVLVGFGWKTCVGFDAVVSALLSVIIFAVAYRLSAQAELRSVVRVIVGLAAAMLTLLLRQPGRPDELAMLFSYTSVWLLLSLKANTPTAIASGVLAGLTLCTSIGAAIAFAPLIALLWVQRLSRRDWFITSAVFGASAAVVILGCLLPLYLAEPTFYRQFFTHAEAATASMPLERMASAVALAWQVAKPRALVMIAVLPLIFFGAVLAWRTRPRLETFAWYGAPLLGLAVLLSLRPAHTYWWFLQPWFVVVAFIVTARLGQRSACSAALPCLWLFLCIGAAIVWPAKDIFARSSLRPSQRLDEASLRLRSVVPPGATVMTTLGWWALAADRQVIDPHLSDASDLTGIEFFVADGNGTGAPGVWRKPANLRYQKAIEENFKVVSDDLPRDRLTLFGRPISGSAYGFGTVVMRRVTDGSADAAR